MGISHTLSRIASALRTPGYQRTLACRRWAAAALVAVAGLSFAGSYFSRDPAILTFARTVKAGTVIEDGDVQLSHVPADLVPENSLTDLEQAVGHVAAAHGSLGQPITSVQLLGKELTAAHVMQITDNFPPGSHTMVPIKLAEPDIIPLLHPGDEVSIVAAGRENGASEVIATGGRVVFAGETTTTDAETVLLLLPEIIAPSVASASLSNPLTVVLTGARTSS